MKDGFKVIDADRHILEPTDLYQNYLPEKFKNRVRLAGPNQTVREVDGKPVSDSAQRPGRATEDFGYIFSSSKRWRECFADAYANKFDPASNLRDMEREGIDVSVLFPTIGLYIMWRDDIDPELSAAICRAYNTWLADYCDHDQRAGNEFDQTGDPEKRHEGRGCPVDAKRYCKYPRARHKK